MIGNDSYQSATVLHNARADAKAVGKALEATGFTVTVKQDLNLKAMKEALRAFKAQVAGGDEAIFYFSGHGVQFEGTNYLIPIDLVPQSEEQVADEAVPLQRVLDDLRDQKARFTLAVIDACRDNPFKGAGRAIGKRGLAPVTAATGQMVLYSAGAGQEALDRLGDRDPDPNGLFTRVFVKEIAKPGVPADQILKNVRDQVVRLARSVSHEQVPALYDQSIGDFFFIPGKPSGAPAAALASTNPAPHVDNPAEVEQAYWDRIKDSTDAADFRDYAKTFPSGPHLAQSNLALRKLTRAPAATATPVSTSTAPIAPAAAASGPVAARAQGTWFMLVPNPKGVSTWYWQIRGDGTYSFWSDGPGAVSSHAGTVHFQDGQWTLASPTNNWNDGGSYDLSDPNTLVATGRLGKGVWHRR